MAIINFFKKTVHEIPKRAFMARNPERPFQNFVTEALTKIDIRQATKAWPIKDLEDHPTDFKLLEDVYLGVPIVYGAINKTVDAAVGPGFRVDSESIIASDLLNQFIKEQNFDILLRSITRDLLIYGTAFVEVIGPQIKRLQTLTPKFMYVVRDEVGTVQDFIWWKGGASKPQVFKTKEIIQFNHNIVGNKAYGTSILQPILRTIERHLNMESDAVKIFSRKAGAPIHVKVGNPAEPRINADDLEEMRQSLEDMRNNQEYVTSADVEMTALDFAGKIIDPRPLIDFMRDQEIFALEVPLVLLGQGNIPEGLAQAQSEAFAKRIQSIQQSIEMVLETELFTKILLNSNLAAEVEFEWKSPSQDERMKEVAVLQQLAQIGMNGAFSMEFMGLIEERIRELLGFEMPKLTGEELMQMPVNRPPGPPQPEHMEDLKLVESLLLFEPTDEVPFKEIINYDSYIESIKEYIRSNAFVKRIGLKAKDTSLPATKNNEVRLTYDLSESLSKNQIGQLRNVMEEGFTKGKSIRDISIGIQKQVLKGKDHTFTIVRGGEERKVTISSERRSLLMARTESVKAANEGALRQFQKDEVERVVWMTAQLPTTCEFCQSLDHTTMTLQESMQFDYPPHINCYCKIVALP